MANVTSLRACTAFTVAATLFTSLKPTMPQKSFESVIPCPLLLITIAIFISEPALPPIPVYTDKGIEKRQCAPSNSPFKILSRTLAHEASFESSTSTPYFANNPNSLAATSGAQSVSGINPNLIFFPEGVGFADNCSVVATKPTNTNTCFNRVFAFITIMKWFKTILRPTPIGLRKLYIEK